MAEWITSVSNQKLRVRLEWCELAQARTAAEYSRGRLWIWLGDELVWGKQIGHDCLPFEWTWIELLEYLSESWPYLKWEEEYPLALRPRFPSQLRDDAEQRWDELTEERALEESVQVFAFENRHDLSRGLQGVVAQAIWMVREGELMWVCTRKSAFKLPATEVMSLLAHLGDEIANRLQDCTEPRAQAARDDWSARCAVGYWEAAEIATGVPQEELGAMLAKYSPQMSNTETFAMTEYFALARFMVGSLASQDIDAALSAVSHIGFVETPYLDELSRTATALLDPRKRPFEEGYQIANWLRSIEGISPEGPVYPAELLGKYGVPIFEVAISDQRLDALACWGPKHGPAILVNKCGMHAQTDPGEKATLAHEICHLLLDRHGSLPLAEVLSGSAPINVEQRANAFAAELLLPRATAKAAVGSHASVRDAVAALKAQFGVSRELAINQIKNAGVPGDLEIELERLRADSANW